MDLRGSSSSLVSGSRVSAIPPDPMCWEMAVLVRTGEAGVKAAAEPKRAAMIASLYCVDLSDKWVVSVYIIYLCHCK